MKPAKPDLFRELLEDGNTLVHLDGRVVGVDVPAEIKRAGHVILAYGTRDMRTAIPDLTVDDKGITATLSFEERPRRTFVPWKAVFAIEGRSGGVVYKTDAPPDLNANLFQLQILPRDPGRAVC